MLVDHDKSDSYRYWMSDREEGLKTQGRKLAEWRKAQPGEGDKHLTQLAAAKRIGATQGAWGAWEKGRKAPEMHFANAIDDLTRGAVPARGWAFPRPRTVEARHHAEAKAS